MAQGSTSGPLAGPPDRTQGTAQGSTSGPLAGPPDRTQGTAQGSTSGPLAGPPDRTQGTLAIYRRILGAQVRSFASYRASFAIDLMTNGLVPLTDVAAVVAVFHVTRTLGGFTAF